MKKEAKHNIKKHILSVLSVAVITVLVILLIVVTRKPEEAVAGITINGKTYNKDNPMVILQILSDKTYDEFGALVGNDYGPMPWNSIMKKAGTTIKSSDTEIKDAIVAYLQYVNSIIYTSADKYCLCVQNGNDTTMRYGTTYKELFGTDADVKTSDLKLYLCNQNSDNTYSLIKDKNNNELKIRDVFSYFVFGDGDAEGCVTVKTVTPDELNGLWLAEAQKIIDSAALININCSRHQTFITQTVYESIMGKSENPWPGSSKKNWTLGDDKLDLNPQIAVYLMMQNISNGKAVMYQSTDKDPGSDGKYSNIARVVLTFSGIDRNVLVSDFAFKTDISINNTEYKGNFGGIKIEDGTFYYYADDSNLYIDPWGKKNNDSIPVFNGNGPFCEWKSYQEYYRKIMGLPTDTWDWIKTYPFYNATSGSHGQNYLDKYCWEFNSDTSSTSGWLTAEKYPSNADQTDKNYGTTYNEAKKLTENNTTVKSGPELSGARAIQYIIGAYKSTPSETLNILEIQPIGVYSYDTADKAKKIKTWFGISADDTSVTVNVTSLSANGVNGLNEDFLATYDLIILGAQGSGSINNTQADYRTDKNETGTGDYSIFGKLYNKGNSIHEDIIRNVTISNDGNHHRPEAGYYNSFKLNGNDLTDKVYNQILDYAKKGLPIAMEKDIFYGNTDLVDTDTNVFKCNINKVAKELYSTGYSNIVSINSNGSTSDILNYYVKPKVSIIPKYTDAEGVSHAIVNYKYDESSNSGELNPRSALETLYFNGDVTANSEFTVNVYLDIDCDSVFTDEEKYYSETGSGSLSNFTVRNIKTVPANIPGYVMYKVEIVDNNGLRENYISSFAIDPGTNKRTVKVLQIIPDRNDKSKLTLDLESEEGLFRTLFSDVENITGLRLSVDVVDKEQFSNGIHNNTIDLDLYSMIVLGFQDNYGRENNDKLTDKAVNAIKQFIDQDKSVLMTHDSMSYMKTNWKEYDSDENKFLNQVAGYESEANSITKLLRTAIGMKSTYQFTDVLSYTRLKITPFSWYKSPTTITTANADGSINSKTKTTNKISQLNSGEITSYPYAITNEMASEISVAKTHAQYFPLDLTLGSTRTSDVVVWYTLSDPDVTQDMYNNREYNSDGNPDSTKTKAASDYKDYVTVYPRDSSSDSVDKANSAKGYYGYFGQDAVNNYYIYSYGNVTYSSAGHSDMNGAGNEVEMKLFVNTFTRAILAGTVIPDVSYEEAVIDESVTDHKEYVKYNYADYVDSKLTVKFKIDDANYVSGASDVNTFIYLYDADNGPEDGLYKSGSSYCTFLGYLDLESTKEKINYANIKGNAPSANSILSGEVYVIDNLWDYITDSDLQDKIINGKLKIGIQATNKYGKGYALLLNQSRKIFNLD